MKYIYLYTLIAWSQICYIICITWSHSPLFDVFLVLFPIFFSIMCMVCFHLLLIDENCFTFSSNYADASRTFSSRNTGGICWMCDITLSYVWYDLFIRVTNSSGAHLQNSLTCRIPNNSRSVFQWHDSITRMTWLIRHTCVMKHLNAEFAIYMYMFTYKCKYVYVYTYIHIYT